MNWNRGIVTSEIHKVSEIRLVVVSMNLIKRPILIYLLLGSMLTLLAYCTQMLM